jgi:uncharacterized membrane protein
VAVIILDRSSRQYGKILSRYRKTGTGMLVAGALTVFVLAGTAIGAGLFMARKDLVRSFKFFGWTLPAECIIGGNVFLMVAYLLWRLRSGLMKDNGMQSETE